MSAELERRLQEVTNEYCVDVIYAYKNKQGKVNIKLSHPIYYVEQEKMMNKMREIVSINSVEWNES